MRKNSINHKAHNFDKSKKVKYLKNGTRYFIYNKRLVPLQTSQRSIHSLLVALTPPSNFECLNIVKLNKTTIVIQS